MASLVSVSVKPALTLSDGLIPHIPVVEGDDIDVQHHAQVLMERVLNEETEVETNKEA
jgi:hypothetical protein